MFAAAYMYLKVSFQSLFAKYTLTFSNLEVCECVLMQMVTLVIWCFLRNHMFAYRLFILVSSCKSSANAKAEQLVFCYCFVFFILRGSGCFNFKTHNEVKFVLSYKSTAPTEDMKVVTFAFPLGTWGFQTT